MFDHRHYVPILKWKRGEQIALRRLPLNIKTRITPLIEFDPKHFSGCNKDSHVVLDEVLRKKTNELQKNWGTLPFFLDLKYINNTFLTSRGEHPLTGLAREFTHRELNMIPVTGLDREEVYQQAVKSVLSLTATTICLRLTGAELESEELNSRILDLVNSLSLSVSHIHLIVDYGHIVDHAPNLQHIEKSVDHVKDYCTYSVASGAFPRDLTELDKNSQHILARTDWLAWRNQVLSPANHLSRMPTYSDYCIIHPIRTFLPRFPNVSASIRYTYDDYWVIMRGEGLLNKDGPGYRQYPFQALLLCERNEYCGPEFSAGDAYLRQLSQERGNSKGTPEALLRAGVNHHITYVVSQLAGLFATAGAV